MLSLLLNVPVFFKPALANIRTAPPRVPLVCVRGDSRLNVKLCQELFLKRIIMRILSLLFEASKIRNNYDNSFLKNSN